jgi:hypothetical protein
MHVLNVFGFAIWRGSLYNPHLFIICLIIELRKGGHYVFESINRRRDHRKIP